MPKKHHYIARIQWPGLKPCTAGTLIVERGKLEGQELYDAMVEYLHSFIPDGFKILRISLGAVTSWEGELLWEPSMRMED